MKIIFIYFIIISLFSQNSLNKELNISDSISNNSYKIVNMLKRDTLKNGIFSKEDSVKLNKIACNIFEFKLLRILNGFTGPKDSVNYYPIFLFFLNTTGIPPEHVGGPAMFWKLTTNDYYQWAKWYLQNKKKLFYDVVNDTIILLE